MARRLVGGVLAAVVALVGVARGAPATPSKKADRRPAPAMMSLERLGAEYRRLRAFEADPKESKRHDADLQPWGGRMQQVMNELGSRLGAAGTPTRKLVGVMGKPDEIQHADGQFWTFVRAPDATALYLYWWRHHDLLYFEVRGDAILRSSWWYPGE
jgi:hypothetical protein